MSSTLTLGPRDDIGKQEVAVTSLLAMCDHAVNASCKVGGARSISIGQQVRRMESTRKGRKPEGEGKAEPENELSEVDQLKSELSKEHDLYLRALADFDNYRRRVEREAEASARSGKRQMILSLLDIIDSFDRALSHTTEGAAVSEGYKAIYRKLLGLLQSQGVTPFESIGESFDPAVHEAIGTVETDEYEAGTVADEVQRGYRWGGDVLRPARVRVAD